MADLFPRLPADVALDLCSLAAAHGLTLEDVILDLINGNYDPATGCFNVAYPERVSAL